MLLGNTRVTRVPGRWFVTRRRRVPVSSAGHQREPCQAHANTVGHFQGTETVNVLHLSRHTFLKQIKSNPNKLRFIFLKLHVRCCMRACTCFPYMLNKGS